MCHAETMQVNVFNKNTLINNLTVHSGSVFKGLQVMIENQFFNQSIQMNGIESSRHSILLKTTYYLDTTKLWIFVLDMDHDSSVSLISLRVLRVCV